MLSRLHHEPPPSREPERVRRLLGFVRRFLRHRRALAFGVACIPVVAACDIRLTLWFGDALTRLQAEEDPAFLKGLFFAILGVAAVQGLFRYLQRWWIVGVSRKVEAELKQELFDKLESLPLAFHVQSRSGDIISRLTSDVENVRMLIGPGSMYVLGSLFMVPGSLAVLFHISPGVTLAMSFPLLLVTVAMMIMTPKLQRHSTAVQESLAEIAARAQESFAGVRVVKGYGLVRHEIARFRAVSETNRTHQLKLARVSGLQDAWIHLSYDLAFLPVLVVGGWAMIDRTLAVGDLFKFIDLGFKVFWPVIALGWIAGLFPRAVASAQRIDEVLDQRSEIVEANDARTLPSVAGALALREVSYVYAGAARPALTGITLDVPAGTTLGVVGPTGSGKSTLLNLLGRLFEAQGEIRLDGVPVKSLTLDCLRGALAYVPQDSFLFSDTYRANLEFGADGPLDEAALRGLVEQVAMTSEVNAFPSGLEQLIGERGVTLSGGQRQRTCIARALARDPRVLILDDALSAVDTETESRLLASLRRAGRGRTVVVAAHRLGTVRAAEQILVLREGRPEALGTHEELLERSRWYRETWERQRMSAELAEL
ncbi:MAG: ABC transporter ATP-binding protein [Planctomycetes bacterium]|nr:ABC transporter ATP-binding protein [Planctomycetota bacterium]